MKKMSIYFALIFAFFGNTSVLFAGDTEDLFGNMIIKNKSSVLLSIPSEKSNQTTVKKYIHTGINLADLISWYSDKSEQPPSTGLFPRLRGNDLIKHLVKRRDKLCIAMLRFENDFSKVTEADLRTLLLHTFKLKETQA